MDWSGLRLWDFSRVGRIYAVKVTDTAVGTEAKDRIEDGNVAFEVHVTSSGRLIGYTGRERRRPTPAVLVRPSFLGIFYSRVRTVREQAKRPIDVMFHDYNLRFLAFGEDERRDYMLVLRARK